ncbi:MAG: SDR family NAD(P)-dependent oxidoreductase [Alphaproteobacteria bacterium]|nr:SDR family NAD(P)-dependent oxidoreductase [Alphaproteobacteria bacterium]
MNDQVVFITGATSGFGAASARRYAKAGATLVLLARRMDRLTTLQEELETPVHVLNVDVRDRDAVYDGVRSLPAPFDEIDVLINNAGLALGLDKVQDADIEDWEVMIDTNIKGLLYATHAVLPGMVARRHGHIVNLGSVAGTYAYPGGNIYGATKAFVNFFSLQLRADLLGKGIRATSLEPGLCETDFSETRFKGDSERAAAVYENSGALPAEDIAELIFWITSLPNRININRLEVMPLTQSFAPLSIHRED